MSKVPSFIGVYDIAPLDYCEAMIERLNHLIETGSGFFGQDGHGGTRNRLDVSRFFNTDSPDLAQQTNNILDQALDQYREEFPAVGMCGMHSNQVKVQRTPPKGGFHVWHAEQGPGESSTRSLVWMIYLNDTPEGEGTTEFLEFGVRLQPKAGRVVFFPAAWTHIHRGNPVYSHDKYIATGWYYLYGD